MTKHVRALALLALGGCPMMHGPYDDIEPVRPREGVTAIPAPPGSVTAIPAPPGSVTAIPAPPEGVTVVPTPPTNVTAVPVFPDAGVTTPGVTQGVLCESFTVRGGRVVVPDVLIVLDRSSSMRTEKVNRWDPSVSGLKAITSALTAGVRFGLMVFPGTAGEATGASSSCVPGSLEVPLALNNAAALANRLDTLILQQTTPTAPTLEVAHVVLKNRRAPRGSVLGPAYVILVTDGSPNCAVEGDVTLEGGSPAAVEQALRAVDAMNKDGIKTFVLGYDTEGDSRLKATLDRLAQLGGTGDTTHRAVDNEAGLTAAFRDITGIAVGCAFNLSQRPLDTDHVIVNLAGAPLQAGDVDGWSLGPDGRTLSIQGKACDLLSNGADAPVLQVGVRCAPVLAL